MGIKLERTLDDAELGLNNAINSLKDVVSSYKRVVMCCDYEKEKQDEIERKANVLISKCYVLMNQLDVQIDEIYDIRDKDKEFFELCDKKYYVS